MQYQVKATGLHALLFIFLEEPESTKRGKQYFFYPATDDDNIEFESEGELKQAREIRRLRGELRHYMKKVEELQCEQPSVVKNSDKRIKKRKQEDRRLSDDEEDRRQAARQEEQAARSARMLYTLQTQVGMSQGPCHIFDPLSGHDENKFSACPRGKLWLVPTCPDSSLLCAVSPLL